MSFPNTRLRRLRRTPAMRSLVRETSIAPGNLMLPMFVQHGVAARDEIAAIPGHARLSVDLALDVAREARDAGLAGVLLFGIAGTKDTEGSEAWSDQGAVQQMLRACREQLPELLIAADLCLCQYTDHGHCGVLDEGGTINNDRTLERLARVAVSHARAGADIVAPSDMMDGRIGRLREALDTSGFADTALLSYSSKFASAFYGPFREAAGSTPLEGDRRTYQMDPANGREAVRESQFDLAEGADMLMVKPALPYLDVVRRVKDATGVPLACYHVSGEYAMVKAAAERGWVDERAVLLESLISMRRAGADLVITYAALEAAGWLVDA